MYFKKLEPNLLIDDDRYFGDSVVLFFEITLGCPYCKTTKKVLSKGKTLGVLPFGNVSDGLIKIRESLLEQIRSFNGVRTELQQIACDGCGIISVIPDKSYDKLQLNARHAKILMRAERKLINGEFSDTAPVQVR